MNRYDHLDNAALIELVRDYKWLTLQPYITLTDLANELANRLEHSDRSIEETIDGYLERRS